ncbi:MAG: hypothetical protein N4A33_05900 [Bacteriovoracaceae bacterium]|jgi:hypothetical protein|nr:hypothetical protein [Bacteriovoracaceae bacterium]
MKNLIYRSLVACLFIIGSTSYGQDLDDHISLTQSSVDYMVRDLSDLNSSDMLNAPGYYSWKSNYIKEFEKRLSTYETKLEREVYQPLKQVVSRYLKVQQDKEMREDQKKALLESYLVQLNSIVPNIEKNFHNALRELYISNNILPYDLYYERHEIINRRFFRKNQSEIEHHMLLSFGDQVKVKAGSFEHEKLVNLMAERNIGPIAHYTWSGNTYYGTYSYIINEGSVNNWTIVKREKGASTIDPEYKESYDEQFEKNFKSAYALILKNMPIDISHQRIIKGCQTQSCFVMKSSDLTFELSSIKATLDQDIQIKLPFFGKEKVLTIKSLDYYIGGYLDVLKRQDFSDKITKLPFEL